jgi:hypothetical protein
MYEFAQAAKIIIGEYVSDEKTNWAKIRLLLYEKGLDADLYIRLTQKLISVTGQVVHTVEFTNIAGFIFQNIDPDYQNEENPSTTATAWKSLSNAKSMYNDANNVWIERDMSKQFWTAVDASYDAHTHLQNWWASIGTEIPAEQTHTERVFSNLKRNLQVQWKENIKKTTLHSKKPILKVPVKTGIQTCGERDNPGWCTECVVMDNLIETVVEQGEAMGEFYSIKFPKILNNVSAYFNELGEYNSDFFEGTFSRLESTTPKVPKTYVRWSYHVAKDWEDFFADFGEYIVNGTHKEIWLAQVDKFLDASRKFVQSTEDGEYVPFYGYSFYHMYNYVLFSSCNKEDSIYVTTTTEQERLNRMDTAIITCAIIVLIIITNTTWSIVPLVWLANTAVISTIVQYVYLYMVYGYFLNCIPTIPYTIMEDFNAWWHTRLDPGCFYKQLPFIAVNASEDTCLMCASTQEYINCANYTAANFEEGMLPLNELMEEYSIAWPFLFFIRWKFPEIAVFAVKNGILKFETVLGRLAMGAWQQEPVDPVWIDCYNAMWLDNILVGAIGILAAYVATKLTIIAIQTVVQMAILIVYVYTTLCYMSLAVEKSVVIN